MQFIPDQIGQPGCKLRPVPGFIYRAKRSPYVDRPISVWPYWELKEDGVWIDVGHIRQGDWWCYLSSTDFGMSEPIEMTIQGDESHIVDINFDSFRVEERWPIKVGNLPGSAFMDPLVFQKIGQMPITQMGGAMDPEDIGSGEVAMDPRATSALVCQLFISLDPELVNGAYFWPVSLDALRQMNAKAESKNEIDLTGRSPILSATLPAHGDPKDWSVVEIDPLPNSNGVLPMFPADFSGLIVSNLDCQIYGMPPAKYRLMRILAGQNKSAQEMVVEVMPPQ